MGIEVSNWQQHWRVINLCGKVFSKLRVVSFAFKRGHVYLWNCVCECGTTSVVRGCNLKSGAVKSCGCLARSRARAFTAVRGASKEPEHGLWRTIITRCTNPNSRSFRKYGGRGISVCDRWLIFENFLHDMGPRPSRLYSVERKDNSLGYEPSNCRWATSKEQANNTRRNRWIEHAGTTLTLGGWAIVTGIKRETIANRLNKGWDTARALGL